MGLLDDAIREHLDLQRRRGADPTEVERAEQEALGPVRRAPESAPAEDEVAHEPEALEPAPGAHEASSWTFEPAPGSEPSAFKPPAFDQEAHSWSYEDAQPPPEAPPPPPTRAQPPLAEPEDDPFAEPTPPPPPHPAGAATGGKTVEYDVEAPLDSEPEREGAEGTDGEDVLEETPEFLQDTPDHDRLWFEQRPPKDFDFDG